MNYKLLIVGLVFITMACFAFAFTITWDAPLEGTHLSRADSPYVLRVNISSAVSMNNVTFYRDSSLIGANNTPGLNFYSYSWNLTSLNGTYVLNASGIDNGTIVNSSIVMIFADGINPTVTLRSPPNGYTSNTTLITLNFTAIDYNLSYCLIYTNLSGWSSYYIYYEIGAVNVTEINVSTFSEGTFKWGVFCNDSVNNSAWGTPNRTFTVDATPYISNISNTSTNQSALIIWNTDVASNSSVKYGITLTLGLGIFANSSMVTSHTINLTGLSNYTLYYYNITSCDIGQDCNTTGSFNFTTLPNAAPDSISPSNLNITNVSITNSSALVTWTTNEAANSSVRYGPNVLFLGMSNSSGNFDTSHSLTLIYLDNNTMNFFNVTSCDSSGNCNTTGPFNFTTLSNNDTYAPTISDVANSSISNESAVITWTTNENANSSIKYGININLTLGANGSATLTTSHSLTLINLQNYTLYYYNATSCDSTYNCNTTGPFNFTTQQNNITDLTSPKIIDVTNTSITNESAIVSWTTDESANSSVRYGPDVLYIGMSNSSSSFETSHSLTLIHLDNNTINFFNITSCDSSGNCNTTGPYNFTTLETSVNDTVPPRINGVANTSITNQSAIIVWGTDENANSSVKYGTNYNLTSGLNASPTFEASHSLTLTTLQNNTLYYYNVTSCDSSNNCNQTGPFNFTTLAYTPPDTTPPRLYNITNTSTANVSTLITWTTDESSDSNIDYGYTIQVALGSVGNSTLVLSHSLNISGLTNNTLYYYNVTSCDAVFNCNETGPFNFSTLGIALPESIPPIIFNISVSITNQSATIIWITDEESNSSIKYGITEFLGLGTFGYSGLEISHTVPLDGLMNRTLYYYNITSCDTFGNCNTTGPFNFTTSQQLGVYNDTENIKITSSVANHTNPRIALDRYDNPLITWQSDKDSGYIYVQDLNDPTTGAATVSASSELPQNPVIHLASDPNLTRGSRLHLVWQEKSGEVYNLYYKQYWYKWTATPYTTYISAMQLASDEGYNPSITTDSDGNVHIISDALNTYLNQYEIHYMKIDKCGGTIVPNNYMTNTNGTTEYGDIIYSDANIIYTAWHDNETGNTEIYGIYSGQDLGIAEITFSEAMPGNYSNFEITAIVKNYGLEVEGIDVRFYDNLTNIANTTTQILQASENYSFTIYYNTSIVGLHTIRAVVDEDNEIHELNENNNDLLANITLYNDSDLDGLSDPMETDLGTNVSNSDTDGDGVTDGDEIKNYYKWDILEAEDFGYYNGDETIVDLPNDNFFPVKIQQWGVNLYTDNRTGDRNFAEIIIRVDLDEVGNYSIISFGNGKVGYSDRSIDEFFKGMGDTLFLETINMNLTKNGIIVTPQETDKSYIYRIVGTGIARKPGSNTECLGGKCVIRTKTVAGMYHYQNWYEITEPGMYNISLSIKMPIAAEKLPCKYRPYINNITTVTLSTGNFIVMKKGINATNPDTDGDNLLDGLEILANCSPLNTDIDEDGISDYSEVNVSLGGGYVTNCADRDTDHDGIFDGIEIGLNGSNTDDYREIRKSLFFCQFSQYCVKIAF